jgi:hypothetical protein
VFDAHASAPFLPKGGALMDDAFAPSLAPATESSAPLPNEASEVLTGKPHFSSMFAVK